MWFRNLLVYRLTTNIPFDIDTLEAALAGKRARPCASQELSTYGFVAPIGKGEDAPLAHASQGFIMIATRKEERILPGSVVKDAVKEKVDEIESEQMRKVYKKERDQIKDEIIQAFLPRAFVRKSRTFAAIAPQLGLIIVDASSPKRAEDLLSTLREVIGSLPVRPLTVKIAPSATLTDWIKTGNAGQDFYVLDKATFTDTHEDGGKITATRQDMTSEEIQMHIDAGKQVTQLSLGWQDKLSFTLDDKMCIKSLRFEDLLQDQAEQDGGDDELGQQDASFVLMMMTLAEFIPALTEALGGEEIPEGI
jgi:recombination associated protein RdgC